MRIDPKFFNHFMIVLAVFCIIAIAFASFRYVGKQEQRFLDRLEHSSPGELVFTDTQGDTIRIEPDRIVIVLFWSTWSDRSLGVLYDLYRWHDQHPQFEVISAYVKDAADFARVHDRQDVQRFTLLDGTGAYQDLRVPGVPAAIIFGSGGDVLYTQVGTKPVAVWHELSSRQQLHYTRKPHEE